MMLLLSIVVSALSLTALALRDPKRLRWRQKLARHGATPAKAFSPLPQRQRKWLFTAMLVPGALLALAGMWASLMLWLGASLTYGWLLSEVLAARR